MRAHLGVGSFSISVVYNSLGHRAHGPQTANSPPWASGNWQMTSVSELPNQSVKGLACQ